MTDVTAIEQRDEAIVEALVAGRSVRAVQREFSLTITELDQVLERVSRSMSRQDCGRSGAILAGSIG